MVETPKASEGSKALSEVYEPNRLFAHMVIGQAAMVLIVTRRRRATGAYCQFAASTGCKVA